MCTKQGVMQLLYIRSDIYQRGHYHTDISHMRGANIMMNKHNDNKNKRNVHAQKC